MATRRAVLNRNVCLILLHIVNTTRSEGNLALSKTATQSSNQNTDRWLASAAVDGCESTDIVSGCCTHTHSFGSTEAWWRVDVGQMSTINTIKILYRAGYEETFAGYQLYVSNTTDTPTAGFLCYEDTSSTKAEVQLDVTHQCPYVGRYVTVYTYRNDPQRHAWYRYDAVLMLCEVLVFGCPIGRYGDGDCDQTCPGNCYGGNCNPRNSSCFYCFPGKYGDACGKDCPTNCKNSLCNKESGDCLECITGKYGNTCNLDCPVNCKDGCVMDTGYCTECVPGKYGNTCDQDCPVNCKDRCGRNTGYCIECVAGKYGILCDLDCSVNCKDGLCAKATGYCTECIPGKYGNTCDQDCSVNCKDMMCAKNTGYCTECIPGKYGNTCVQDCPVNCKDRCGRNTGYCTECVAGKYGILCDLDCSVNCKDGLCAKDTGYCTGCTTGRYGETCTFTCPVTCKDFTCDQQTGQCLECYPGRYGVVCGADCPTTCMDNICSKNDGQCLTIKNASTTSTTADYKLITIAVLAVICGLLLAALITSVVCQLRKNRNDSSDKNIEPSDPDPHYTSISKEQVEAPNVYEMIVTT